MAAYPGALIARTSAFFGPWDSHNFVWSTLRALAHGERVEASADVVSPTYVPDLAHIVLDLLIDGATGIWHLANPGEISWHGLAMALAQRAGLDARLIDLPHEHRREPVRNTALTSARGVLLPPLESALERYFRDGEVDWAVRERIMAVAAE
jgi:dTDP-4-dehydrorhamnose reductase